MSVVTRGSAAGGARRATEALPAEARLRDVIGVMGGARVVGPIGSVIDLHDLVRDGLPNAAVQSLLDGLVTLSPSDVAKALGVSLRTVQRLRKREGEERLSADQSGRAWQFAEVLSRASEVFGSREAGERWLEEPAIGLDQRRPIDLLGTAVGTEAVKAYLDRIDFGVYA